MAEPSDILAPGRNHPNQLSRCAHRSDDTEEIWADGYATPLLDIQCGRAPPHAEPWSPPPCPTSTRSVISSGLGLQVAVGCYACGQLAAYRVEGTHPDRSVIPRFGSRRP
jgi:hypothetical protein